MTPKARSLSEVKQPIFRKTVITVQTTKEIEEATIELSPLQVAVAVREYVAREIGLANDVQFIGCDPVIDWRGEEYEGFEVKLRRGVSE